MSINNCAVCYHISVGENLSEIIEECWCGFKICQKHEEMNKEHTHTNQQTDKPEEKGEQSV